jgi:hypothetical protein
LPAIPVQEKRQVEEFPDLPLVCLIQPDDFHFFDCTGLPSIWLFSS